MAGLVPRVTRKSSLEAGSVERIAKSDYPAAAPAVAGAATGGPGGGRRGQRISPRLWVT